LLRLSNNQIYEKKDYDEIIYKLCALGAKYAYRDRNHLFGLENMDCLETLHEFIRLKNCLKRDSSKVGRQRENSLDRWAVISIWGV
jgi:hypothetical protein